MPNPFPAFNAHIRSLARKELKGVITEGKKRSAEHRRAIAALKRQVATLTRELAAVRKHLPTGPKEVPGEVIQKSRLRIDGMKAHRKRLGLSAGDFAKLLGVSGLTVYNWESGKTRPRRSQLPRIVQVRSLGKREAIEALRMMKV